MFDRLAQLATQYPRRVLFFWFALLLLGVPLAGKVGAVLTNVTGDAPNSRSRVVRDIVASEFATLNQTSLILIADAAESAALPDAWQRAWDETLSRLAASSLVAAVQTPAGNPVLPGFENGDVSVAVLELTATTKREALDAYEQLHPLMPPEGVAGLTFFLTGDAAIDHELQQISKRDALRAELIGLSISLLVLFVAFGALVAASLPLVVAVVSITLSMATLYLLGQVTPVASFAQSMVTLLGLATGIDYALLMVNRYREELANGLSPAQAAHRTTTSAGKAVSVSGLTVLVALSALLIPPLALIRSMGVASMIVMFFSVAVSVTALPALLTLLGPKVNALRLSRAEPGTRSRSFWERRAAVIMRRPVLWTVFGSAVLILIALPAFGMRLSIAGVEGLTENTETRRAADALGRVGLGQLQQSLDVLVDFGAQGFYHPSSVRNMAELTRATQDLPGSSEVLSPATTGGLPTLLAYQYYASADLTAASPLADLARSTVSQDGRYGLLRVFPESSDPGVVAGLVRALRGATQDQNLRAMIGGPLVSDQEWTNTLYRSFPWAVLYVYVATFILLGLAFRSIVIPIKSILLNTLTVLASFGVITAVFQNGWLAQAFGLSGGLGFIETSVPIFIFAVVFGLSMDYEVFMVSRIVEGHQRGLDDHTAVRRALASTGSVITSAALIMVIVFSVFIFSHIVLIKTLSLGLTVAVLLDATLVRLALVPSVMVLTRRWNWWFPRPMARLAKRVDLGHD